MPELPEVETIARGLAPLVIGKSFTDLVVHYAGSLHEDESNFKRSVLNSPIAKVWRRAKLLIIDLTNNTHLVFHLKMTGRVLVVSKNAELEKHSHLEFILSNRNRLIFQDQRKFGYCKSFTNQSLHEWSFYKTLGPEPLEINKEEFKKVLQGKTGKIKSLLLNQQVIAGIGNIYADESLFLSGIHPMTSATDLNEIQIDQLHSSLQLVLKKALDVGGSSLRDYVDALGKKGFFQEQFFVYGQKGKSCARCESELQAAKVAGRTSVFCPQCQPRG